MVTIADVTDVLVDDKVTALYDDVDVPQLEDTYTITVYVLVDALYTTAVVYTYCPDDEHATDVRDEEVVDDTDTVVQSTPPSVETYTVDVGLVTVTYI